MRSPIHRNPFLTPPVQAFVPGDMANVRVTEDEEVNPEHKN
ncbi:MAG TPA: hypothetical protein VMM78_09080 [Thermomicrobiales bacterium]|nr:hypothetical protein [Thermomicrobiales bacterium]